MCSQVVSLCGEPKNSFRPLSRGLFFNQVEDEWQNYFTKVFVPSLGDFFSMAGDKMIIPLLIVFVPSLGDFFSIKYCLTKFETLPGCFRPLSRGLFFNKHGKSRWSDQSLLFSSPLSGTFFQSVNCNVSIKNVKGSFRPLSRGLFFNY